VLAAGKAKALSENLDVKGQILEVIAVWPRVNITYAL
jgi:hypothetical protein